MQTLGYGDYNPDNALISHDKKQLLSRIFKTSQTDFVLKGLIYLDKKLNPSHRSLIL